MRHVETKRPSFPPVTPDLPLSLESGVRWQVACGDEGHWRVGYYSPGDTSARAIQELEQHDCPELFLLLSGRVSLLLKKEGGLEVVELQPMKPILVECPHCGFCPDGPHSGIAMVVERDAFQTEYRKPEEW